MKIMKTNKETLLINLYGAPGSGKSTGAAYIFYKLKTLGVDVELVTEYAKDKVWEEHAMVFEDQCYIFGHQHFRLARVDGKVDVIVTDSPLLISAFYSSDAAIREHLTAMANITESNRNGHTLSYFITRVKEYNRNGRFQSEKESDSVASYLKQFLLDNDVEPKNIDGCQEHYQTVVDDAMLWLKLYCNYD